MTKLGIFWIDKNNIYTLQENRDKVIQIDGARDIETGHVDYWNILQNKYQKFKHLGYDQVPRGRVLEKGSKIIVYSSKDIIKNYKDLIINDFDLVKEQVEFIVDEHYAPILDLGFENFD